MPPDSHLPPEAAERPPRVVLDGLASSRSDAELQRLLVENIEDYAIYALDPGGYLRSWNPGVERIKGYSAEEIIGRHFSVFFSDDDVRSGEPERVLEGAARAGSFEGEGWRLRKDGTRFWAHVTVTALHDERGALIGFAKVTRDLTIQRAAEEQARALASESAAREAAERRREEVERLNEQLRQQTMEVEAQSEEAQALTEELEEQATELEAANIELLEALREAEEARELVHESEARYRMLFDANPMPLWVYDRETLRFLAVNTAAVEQYGYSSDEFAAMTVADIRPSEDLAALQAAIADSPRELHRLRGWRHQRKDGSLIDVEIVGHPMKFDGRDAELILVLDVTQRRRAEAELRESTDVLRAVVDDSPLAIIVLDLELRVTRWNPSAEQLLGWTAEEMLGESYRIVIPDEKWGEHTELREDALDGKVTMNVDTLRRRKNGSLVDVSLSVAVLRDPLGTVRGFAVIMADVTERRRLETQFRQAQKMEAVGQLAGGVAHDFNNLLTVITSYSRLLLGDLPEDSPMRADVEQISGAASRAAALTRQLLAFSRQQMLRPQVLALNSVVAGLETMLRRLVREDITIVTNLDASLGAAEADPGQVEQVIVNLVVNARDAMPAGGTLTIETANTVFDGESLLRHSDTPIEPGRYVMLAVSDTGTGMAPEIQARVFEPFYTTKEPGRGTGLGLSTVYGIVKQSGGYIWVYSEPGHGTTFKVYLPRVDAEPDSGSVEESQVAHRTSHETVLVVEDDSALRAVACRVMRQHGYQVFEAQNGREALELCERYDGPIHIVLTDVVMPEMSGGELARRIAVRHSEIRVLLMSGYTRDDVVRQSVVRDGSAFLEKPFTPEKLLARVREVLNSHRPGTDRQRRGQ